MAVTATPGHRVHVGGRGTGSPPRLSGRTGRGPPRAATSCARGTSSDVAHLHQAYDVDVVGAIVATQVAALAMRAAGGGTILFTGGGWADHPGPAWATVSLGKAALRAAATMLGADLAHDGIRVASITIAGQIRPGTPFSPDQIAEKYWSVMQSDGIWQNEFRFDRT